MTDPSDQLGQGRLNEVIDSDAIIDSIGLTQDEIEWRKEFLDFTEADAETLTQFEELFDEHADQVVDSFYDHLTDFEETQAVIERSPKDIPELKQTQKAYLQTLVAGEYDEAYFESRARIGKLHELLDMPVKHYIGQYNIYYGILLGLITDRIHDRITTTVETTLERRRPSQNAEHDSDTEPDSDRIAQRLYEDVEEAINELHSLLKLLNLDLQVAVDTYLQSRLNDTKQERDRFAALFENVPSPVVAVRVTDDGLRVKEVNAAFEKLFGYSATDLTNRDFEQFLTPAGEEPRPIGERTIVQNIQSSTESELSEAEVTLETQFGRREFIRVSAPVANPSLENLEYAFYIDVTDQKQRQERLQVLSRVLRHNIRNNLSTVKGSISTLAAEPDHENKTQLVECAEEAADNLLSTSEKIYKVEQQIAGDVDQRTLEISSLVRTIVERVRSQYPACEWTMSSADDLEVNAPNTIQIAIEEVIGNAVEHNDCSSPEIDVSVTESLDNQYVTIRVADNGPGIPPAEYEVLTGQRDRSQLQHTSGMGLWIVNWIVTQAGGSLEFSANSPRGSIVEIRLPQP
jgi:PAS domain S-box-containing protein